MIAHRARVPLSTLNIGDTFYYLDELYELTDSSLSPASCLARRFTSWGVSVLTSLPKRAEVEPVDVTLVVRPRDSNAHE
jgi:hypothetical protein